jgi:uncharacterized protein
MHRFLHYFGGSSKILIGALHFPPLPGHPDAPTLSTALSNALHDLRSFEEGGMNGIIIENNYDLPHTIKVGPGTIAAMTALGAEIRRATHLPIGVCVLWNDVEASLAIAKAIDAQFVRIPVFVDEVETDFGHIIGKPEEVLSIRRHLKADHIHLIADVHVKHARILSRTDIAASATKALQEGADGVIITGKWTGQPPSIEDLLTVKEAIPDGVILVGSGIAPENAQEILSHVHGAIVSTSLKEGDTTTEERNRKTWRQRIDREKVKLLASAIKPSPDFSHQHA